jgi:hypothetical protein
MHPKVEKTVSALSESTFADELEEVALEKQFPRESDPDEDVWHMGAMFPALNDNAYYSDEPMNLRTISLPLKSYRDHSQAKQRILELLQPGETIYRVFRTGRCWVGHAYVPRKTGEGYE